MKLTISIRQVVSAITLLCATTTALACGPYSDIIPTPQYFDLQWDYESPDYNRKENLKLWQEMTSEKIPLSDIEEAVYKDSYENFLSNTYYNGGGKNKFYRYINNAGRSDIEEFLKLAKTLEECRGKLSSPWYYPQERGENGETCDYEDIIKRCKVDHGKLNDRYALQAIRALYASRKYEQCIEYYDSAFSHTPDNNLMKRMSAPYVAGCRAKMGDKDKANLEYALSGDVYSLDIENRVEYMGEHNPNAPQFMDYIRRCGRDSTTMSEAANIAKNLIRHNKAKYKGDWYFVLSYYYGKHEKQFSVARNYIYQALSQKFSSEEFRDLAKAYKMKLDGKTGNKETMLNDLKWIEQQTDPTEIGNWEWIRRLQNIVYEDWVPKLWESRDYSTAILLCSYADNFNWYLSECQIKKLEDIREREDLGFNYHDYRTFSFQLMESLTSYQLAIVYDNIHSNTPLYNYLRKRARTDKDFYYELIGTLALREENFGRAEYYLSRVSEHYQRTTNIFKEGYLKRNPFALYQAKWDNSTIYTYEPFKFDVKLNYEKVSTQVDAKLNYARTMRKYKRTMKYGSTVDERGLARLMYAIGVSNASEHCWALTQYCHGYAFRFIPILHYWDGEDDYVIKLYEYDEEDTKKVEERYTREVTAALAMLKTDEARAKAEYILGNIKTIVVKYGNTTTGQFVKSSCDNWKNWI